MGITNDDYVEDIHGYSDIGAVGFELWTVNSGSIFDNILVTDSLDAAWDHAAAHWEKITAGEKDAKEAYDKANAPSEPEKDADDEDIDDKDLGDTDQDDLEEE